MVSGCWSKLVIVVSGVQQGRVLGQLLFLLYSSELFSILENKLIGYADDSTLLAVVPYPLVRVTVAVSLIRELGRVSDWCDLLGMKLNASKTTNIRLRQSPCHAQCIPSHPIIDWRNCALMRRPRRLSAELRSTADLYSSQCPCGMILLPLYSMVWDWRV